MNDDWQSLSDLIRHVYMWFIGAAIGVGQVLMCPEPLSWRRIIGRALVAGGLATAAGGILVFAVDTPNLGLFGVAAAISSIGTSTLERWLDRVIEARYPHHRRADDDKERPK